MLIASAFGRTTKTISGSVDFATSPLASQRVRFSVPSRYNESEISAINHHRNRNTGRSSMLRKRPVADVSTFIIRLSFRKSRQLIASAVFTTLSITSELTCQYQIT